MNFVLMIRNVGKLLVLFWTSLDISSGVSVFSAAEKNNIHPQRPLAKFLSNGGKATISLAGFGQSFLC